MTGATADRRSFPKRAVLSNAGRLAVYPVIGGLRRYGLRRYGLRRYGLRRYGLRRYGLRQSCFFTGWIGTGQLAR